MKRYLVRTLLAATAFSFFFAQPSWAGNKDRIGQAGASELLINPWSRSSGWGSANSASVVGLEAAHLNVAGLAFTNKTEVAFAHTRWLSGTEPNRVLGRGV